MYLSSEELKYIKHVLYCASSFTIVRAEQVVSPSIKHEEIKRKIDDELRKVHWK